ncbi:MAG: hypothetical protein ABIQ38_01365 [Ilumatobacteraceae bacterium]
MADLLTELQQIRAFDPTLRFEELGYLHVPFDDLHGSTNVEGRILSAVGRGDRVALIGTTGNGKSSTASYVVSPMNEAIIAFRIGVTVEDPNLLANPGRFAQYVVRHIARDAMEVSAPLRIQLQLDVAETHSVRNERSRRGIGKINAKVFELSGELGVVMRSIDQPTSSHEFIEALDHALELVRSTGAVPVLVIDDSDTWLEVTGAKLSETRRDFFGPIMRMLAERNCGLLVAVDERYLDSDDYKPARDGFLPTEVHVPRLRDAHDLERLFARRISEIERAVVGDVFTDSVIDEIYAHYAGSNLSLRQLMRLVHSSMYHVSTLGESRVGSAAFAASVREFGAEFQTS